MGKLSDYAENKVLDHVLKNTAYSRPANLYLGLCTVLVTDADTGGSVTEVSGGSYTRIAADSWDVASGRATTNSTVMSFPTSSADWGVTRGWMIADVSTLSTGNIIAYGDFSPAKMIVSGDSVDIDKGQLAISFNKGGSSDYLANALLDHLFYNTPFAQPAGLYMALSTVQIVDADTGSTISEPAGGYTRTLVDNWDAAIAGESSNTDIIETAGASADWGNIAYLALTNHLTTGNILHHGDLATAVSIASGKYLKLLANSVTITLN